MLVDYDRHAANNHYDSGYNISYFLRSDRTDLNRYQANQQMTSSHQKLNNVDHDQRQNNKETLKYELFGDCRFWFCLVRNIQWLK